MTFLGVLGTQELFIIFIAVIIPLIVLVEIIRNTFKDPTNKIVWVLIVILLPLLGSLLYLIFGRQQIKRA